MKRGLFDDFIQILELLLYKYDLQGTMKPCKYEL